MVLAQPGPRLAVELDVGRRNACVAPAWRSPAPLLRMPVGTAAGVTCAIGAPAVGRPRCPGIPARLAACAESWATSDRRSDGTALDVVMEGLARLEYRGYDSAGVALVDRRPASRREKRAGKLENLAAALEAHPLAAVAHRHRAHPLGHPRRPDRRQRPPAPRRRRRQAGPDPQRHHRELPRAQARAARRRRRVPLRDRHRGRRPPASAARTTGRGDLTEAMRSVVPAARGRLHAAGRATPTSPASSSAPAATARSSSASATARTSSAPTSRRSSATPAHALELGQDQIVTITPDGRPVIDFDGTPVEGKAYDVDWDAAAAEKGGYADLHGEGDPRPAARRRRHPARPHRRRRPARPRRAARSPRTQLRSGRQDHRRRLRHRRLRRHGRQVRHRALDPHPRRGRAGARVPLPRPGRRRPHAGRLDQPVRRDHGHADGGQARPRARRHDHRRSATPTARPSRASPTPCSTRTPAPRSRSPRPRRSSPRSPRCYLLGLYLAQLRGGDVRRRRAGGHGRAAARSRPRSRRVLDPMDRVARDRPVHGRHPRRCCSSAATSATRWPWRARSSSRSSPTSTPRASPPASSSTARSRSSSPASRSSSSCPSPATAHGAARQGRLQHPGDPRPRRPHHRHRRGGRRRRSCPSPTRSSACPRRSTLLAPLLTVVPLQVFALRAGDGQGPRRRPAAQPRQVGHGRVTP